MAKRLQAMGSPNYRNGFKITLHEHMLDVPFTWKKPRKVFVNSMSDLFHPQVPDEFIHRVFDVMVRCPQHQFQVLTKRPERAAQMSEQLPWPDNIWMGTSVEDMRVVERIDHLRDTEAKTRFLSLEPLIGPLPNLNLLDIHWVIVGGESGPKARPIDEAWVVDLREQCIEWGIPFFFKQWGGRNKKKTGRLLEGRTWDEFPVVGEVGQAELVHA
jgi:protein gp37